jgi:hypothetical protein
MDQTVSIRDSLWFVIARDLFGYKIRIGQIYSDGIISASPSFTGTPKLGVPSAFQVNF